MRTRVIFRRMHYRYSKDKFNDVIRNVSRWGSSAIGIIFFSNLQKFLKVGLNISIEKYNS